MTRGTRLVPRVPSKPATQAIPETKEAADTRKSAAGPSLLGLADCPDWRRNFALSAGEFHDGLQALAVFNQRNTNLLIEELRHMATNDAQLTQAVTDLESAFSTYVTAHGNYEAQLLTEVANLKATVQPDTDPAITTAVGNIQNLVSYMNQSTAAAQAALTPTSSPTPDPTAAGSSLSADGSATGSPSSSPATTTEDSTSATAAG